MADLDQLLVVQSHDTAVDQLEHRREHLAERVEADRLRSAVAEAGQALNTARKALGEAEAVGDSLQSEVGEADARIAEIEKRMFGGAVSSPRELESMSEEVAHLKERRSGLEDRALEAMDATESAGESVGAAESAEEALRAELATAEAALAAAEAELDGLIAVERQAREEAAAALPPDLLARYETIRSKLGGVGAARLDGNRCLGCHLSLPTGEVERLRKEPPDAVLLCENCQRILVR